MVSVALAAGELVRRGVAGDPDDHHPGHALHPVFITALGLAVSCIAVAGAMYSPQVAYEGNEAGPRGFCTMAFGLNGV
jgi:hypothetical protein